MTFFLLYRRYIASGYGAIIKGKAQAVSLRPLDQQQVASDFHHNISCT
jgi:hypothetical protein